ncbi:hypothetical protein IFU00_18425 [Oxalobacteraceae sp. CFBP 8761]|nr:hypothetical protein [Oxalobacteraceae sp. CFBP 8761]
MKKFEDQLIVEFQGFEHAKFNVSFLPPRVFLCGGEVDIKATFPRSARQRLIEYFAASEPDLHNACIQAEDFKDYFKEGAYSDLLEFESDIASVATLIVVCLESPGSMVELGLFCMDPKATGKLLVFAPHEKVAAEDSFIYLGPLAYIKRQDADSVFIYPWPNDSESEYEHLKLMVGDIKQKLEKTQKTQKFSASNRAHIALLIHDIVMLAHPITVTEIEYALLAFKVDQELKTVTRLLYLLEKLGLVGHVVYSGVTYYFDRPGSVRRIKFGTDIKGKTRDTQAISMAFRSVYILGDDELSKKRTLALKQINKLKAEMK